MTRSARNAGVIYTVPFRSIVEPVKKDDIVNTMILPMSSIPAGANPFDHDAHNMGTSISRDWMVMHSGDFNDHGHQSFYLVNTVTGQRIGLDFEAKENRFTESVWAGIKDLDESELYVWSRNFNKVEFYSLIDHLRIKWGSKYGLWRGHKSSPTYVYIGMHFVRIDVVLDAEAFARWCDGNEISVDSTHPAVIAARRYEAAQLLIAGTNDDAPDFVIDRDAVRKRLVLDDEPLRPEDTLPVGDKGVHVRVVGDAE